MKKNDVFTFTAPNGVKVAAVIVDTLKDDEFQKWWLCYAQNRLFYYWCHSQKDYETGELSHCYSYGGTAVDYCVIPELDTLLYGDSEEYSEDNEDLPIEYPHCDDELEALESLKKYF